MIICRCYADVKAPSAPLRPTIQIRNEPLPVWNVVITIGDDVQFERFRAGEDFSNRLADITDAEYSARYDRIVGIILHPASRKARGLWQSSRCARVLFVFAGHFVP